MSNFLDGRHWTEKDFVQRLTNKQWRQILLDGDDQINFKGKTCKLTSNKIGYGLVEVYKRIEEEESKPYDPYQYDIEEFQEWHYIW